MVISKNDRQRLTNRGNFCWNFSDTWDLSKFISNLILIWFIFTIFLLLFTSPNSYCTWLSCHLQSQAVGDAAYDSDWLDASPNVKRSLNLVMTRAKRPCKITAGKFMDLNLESYFLVGINVVNTLYIFSILMLTYTNIWKINPTCYEKPTNTIFDFLILPQALIFNFLAILSPFIDVFQYPTEKNNLALDDTTKIFPIFQILIPSPEPFFFHYFYTARTLQALGFQLIH